MAKISKDAWYKKRLGSMPDEAESPAAATDDDGILEDSGESDGTVTATKSGAAAPPEDSNEELAPVFSGSARVLFNNDGSDYHLRLEESSDGLQLLGEIKPKFAMDLLPEEIRDILGSVGVAAGINETALADFCRRASKKENVSQAVLATGTAPVDGQDERLEFLVQPTLERLPPPTVGRGADAESKLFDNVEAEQKIALLIPPSKGSPGTSVIGEMIPHQSDGKPLPYKIEAGENVRVEEYGREFRATTPGRVDYDRAKHVISVSGQLLLKQGVGAHTGDIDFIGDVDIKGDVPKGFRVKAGGGIHIEGNIEAAFIEAGGDVDIIGGISGQEIGKVVCGGNIQARYLDDAIIESGGDVEVRNEIVNCKISSGGSITVTSGSIIAGECVALKGVEAVGIGSETGANTRITSGVCFLTIREMARIKNLIEEVQTQIKVIGDKINPILRNSENMRRLTPEQKAALKKLMEKTKGLMDSQKQLETRHDEIKTQMRKEANPIVSAKANLHYNVTLILGTSKERIREGVPRGVTVIRNTRQGGMRFIQLHPIARDAHKIEEEIIRVEEEKAKRQQQQGKEVR